MNKKYKIGIITVHNSPSYGGSLQSYALFEFLKLKGYDVEIIDLRRPFDDSYIDTKKYRPYRNDTLLYRIKKSLFKIFRKKSYFSKGSKLKFDRFNSKLNLSTPYYRIDELYSNPPVYDIYISGSDQIWNPGQPFCLEPYFLTFAPKSSKKVSFASSIGTNFLFDNEKSDFKKWLLDYDFISVRERQSKEFLERLTGRSIYCVPDPTFLLDREYWDSIVINPQVDNYILLFSLSFNNDSLKYSLGLAEKYKKKLVVLDQKFPKTKESGFIIERNAGPSEWLGYIKNADLIITNSFHGTVFSLIFGKSFYTFITEKSKQIRIVDLLTDFGMTDRLLPDDYYNRPLIDAIKLDEEKVNNTISNLRQLSLDFCDRIFQ